MRIIGNLLWWLFGGLEAAIGYFTGSLALACTIIGIPFAIQTFKIGLLCLWPFGSTVRESNSPTGCIRIPLNLLWLIFGGLWACLMHLFFGFLLCITIIGIPWGKQHFKMAGLSLAPFGKDVELGFKSETDCADGVFTHKDNNIKNEVYEKFCTKAVVCTTAYADYRHI